MAYNVKFLKGLSTALPAIRDSQTFYLTTDDKQLYLGEEKLSNSTDLAAAVARITANEGDISDIKKSIEDINNEIGTLGDLTTTQKANIVAAINELVEAISGAGTAGEVKLETDATGLIYTLKQGGKLVGTINIPKDMVVQSGKVEVNPSGQPAGTYIHLVLANAESSDIYINVGSLVDIYTPAAGAAQIQLIIDSNTREIGAVIVAGGVDATALAENAVTTVKIADGNVTKVKLETSVQTTLDNVATIEGRVDDLEAAIGEGGSVETQITNKINALDADVSSAVVETGKGIKVQVVETDGKITSVALTGDYNNLYEAKGEASDALDSAKAYTDEALTWQEF